MAAAAVPWIIMGVTAALAAGATVYSEVQQGKATEKQAQMVADQDEYNAKMAEQNARLAREQGGRNADIIRDQQRRVLASQTTAAAKSGLTISGSVIDVMTDTATASNKDIALALYEGDMQSYNFGQDALGYRIDASRAIAAGKDAKRAHYTSAWIAGISGVAEAAGAYSKGRKNTAPGMTGTTTPTGHSIGGNLSMGSWASTPSTFSSAGRAPTFG